MVEPVQTPSGFRWDILAVEVVSAISAVVQQRGFPGVATMRGIPSREDANRLSDEVKMHLFKIEEKWNINGKVKWHRRVIPGKTEAKGWDFELGVERVDGGNSVLVASPMLN